MSIINQSDKVQGISGYFNWGMSILTHVLPTLISKEQLSSIKTQNELLRSLLDATTCFVSKQYMHDPQLQYDSENKGRWFSCVLLGDNWRSVVKGIFHKEFDKKLSKANCIVFNFITPEEEGIDVVLKKKMVIEKDKFLKFKNEIIDKFKLKLIDYKPDDYDPVEGNVFLDPNNLTIRSNSESIKTFWETNKPPYWLYNALDWEVVDQIIIHVKEPTSTPSFSVKSILNKIVIYPDCPTEWREINAGAKALEYIENQVGKSICEFFIFLTISGEGENWYPVLDSALYKTYEHWQPFLKMLEKIGDIQIFFIRLLKRYFAIPEGLTIRENAEYKNIINWFFISKENHLEVNKNFVIPADEESINFILERIGSLDFINESFEIFRKMFCYVKTQLEGMKISDISLQYINYLIKNLEFVEELSKYFPEIIKELDVKNFNYFDSKEESKLNKALQYLLARLLTEKEVQIRKKILAVFLYKNRVIDVVPDYESCGLIDDIYAVAVTLLAMKDNKVEIPEEFILWAEVEKSKVETILGEKTSKVLEILNKIEEFLDMLLKKNK